MKFGQIYILLIICWLLPGPVARAQSDVPPPAEQQISLFDANIDFTGQNYESLPQKGSIMFNDEDLKDLYDALRFYQPAMPKREAGAGEETQRAALPSLEDIAPDELSSRPGTGRKGRRGDGTGNIALPNQPPLPTQAPVFFFNSAMVYSPKDWTLWINGKKIRQNMPPDEFEIARVQKDKVDLIWQTVHLNAVSPGWTAKLSPIKGVTRKASVMKPGQNAKGEEVTVVKGGKGEYSWDYSSPSGDILLDSLTGAIKVRLGINQTFVTHTMEVVEGKASATPLTPPEKQGVAGTELLDDIAAPASTTPPGQSKSLQDENIDELFNEVFASPAKEEQAPAWRAELYKKE